MNNILGNAAYYSEETISTSELDLSTYVTTDSLLANKQGKCDSVNLPPNGEKCTKFENGDILVSNIRPYLKKIWLANIDGGCSADVLVFKAKEEYSSSFLYYALLRDDFFIHSMKGSTGTKMPRGNKDHLLEFLIPDFDYAQQVKISNALSVLDAKININNQINIELEAMAKLIYDYWFVQFDFPDENGRPYKSSGGKMVYNQDLKREIPYGWSISHVGKLLAKEVSKKKILKKHYQKKGDIPIIDQSSEFISGYTNDHSSLIETEVPRIIFGDHTRILKLINFNFARGADGTKCLLSNNNNVPQHFLYHSLIKIDISNYGYSRYFKFLKESKIIVPTVEVSTKFEMIANNLYGKIKNNLFETKKLEEIRDWLIPMLMNGQVTIRK